MQVNLKQKEIETALRNYIAQQGIDLYGKRVEISFTAGRRESGISAELVIDDQDIPGFSDAEESQAAPVLQLAQLNEVTIAAGPAVAQADPVAYVAPEPVTESAVEEPITSTKTSLFS